MTQTAAHDKQVEDLMGAKVFMPGVEDGQLQCVDNAAYGIDDASGQHPHKPGFGHGAEDLCNGKHAHPAHGNVYEGRKPLGTGDPQRVYKDPGSGDSPDQGQERPAGLVTQDDHTNRGISSGNEDKDHHMVNLPQHLVDLRGNVQGMVDGAGRIQPYHTQYEDGQCAYVEIAGVTGGL